MDDTALVRDGNSIRDLTRNRERFRNGERTAGDAIDQRRPFHELEDEGVHLTAVLEPMNRGDIWMIERREHVRLASEPRKAIGVMRERFGQDLQRDVAIEFRVAR